MATNGARSGNSNAVSNNVKQDLQDDMISFYRREHKNIPLSPLMEEDQPLLKFYEMPVIQSVKVTRSRDGDRKDKTHIKTLGNVFYKDNKPCCNIYLTSDAGYGKTAFSKKLALAWCHAKKPDKNEEKHFSTDEITVMGGFSFVFLVLLRDSSNECDIDMLILKLICSQLPNDYSLENLRKILREETCLVILDGLDEWTHQLHSCSQGERKIPHQRARENVAVLTTTRPWKLSVIGLHSSQIDQTLELEGLSNDSAKKLIRSVITYLNGELDESQIDKYETEFNMTLQENHKSDLTAIPLFLMYFLFLWYYRFSVGKSLADLYSCFIELLLSRTVKNETTADTVQGNIPLCFGSKKLCSKFYTLLTSLGKLAFQTLFSETKENALVFDSGVAEKYLTNDLTFCLKTGIITQSKVQGDILLQQKTKVSFAHKTMQEFLAALYINSAPDQKSVQEIVESTCKCVEDIFDLSKILMFIVGIDAKSSFSDVLMKIINDDEITQKYRSSLQQSGAYNYFSHPLKTLQDMYISCCKEIPLGHEVNLCLQDVIIEYSCDKKDYREDLKQLTSRNKQNIRSLYINMAGMQDTPYNTARDVIDYFALSDLENIEKIHYEMGEYSDDDILPLLNSSVKSLSLSCDSAWSVSLLDKVKSLQRVEAIGISKFEMEHSELSELFEFISQRDCLREIELGSFFCTEHWYSCTGQDWTVDLSRHLYLRKITLNELKLSKVLINMVSLENCEFIDLLKKDLVLEFQNCADNKLNTFHCKRLESSAATDEILCMLRESRHVRDVALSFINTGSRNFTLPPDFVNIERLQLSRVPVEASTLQDLFDSVLKLKQTVTVHIEYCTITPRKVFETLKGKIKTSQRVRILRDEKDWFEFVKNKDVD